MTLSVARIRLNVLEYKDLANPNGPDTLNEITEPLMPLLLDDLLCIARRDYDVVMIRLGKCCTTLVCSYVCALVGVRLIVLVSRPLAISCLARLVSWAKTELVGLSVVYPRLIVVRC